MKRKFISVVTVAMLVLSMLIIGGCGKKVTPQKPADNEPTNVKEMFAACKKANKKVESVKFSAEGDAKVVAGSEESKMEVPASFSAEGAATKSAAHITSNASVEMFGQKQEAAPEVYIDTKEGKIYACIEEGEWNVSDIKDSLDKAKESKKEFKMPESLYDILTFSKGENEYKIEGDLSKIDIKALLEESGVEAGQIEDAMNSLEEANFKFDSGKLTMTFDKETKLLKKFKLADIKGSASQEISEGQNTEYSATLNLSFKFTDYNKVDSSEYEVPEDVVKSATSNDIADDIEAVEELDSEAAESEAN